MVMKNPAHLGELIRDNIDELGLSVTEAAKGLGVTRQQLHKDYRAQPRHTRNRRPT
jgi:plasmid maintenance system antidote protein VapI